ncbi:MAG: PAS domain S-box protein [Ignavibacteriales bacterium]|nr:PAS domain S-box protein [Ignavibacteriales bacterium]
MTTFSDHRADENHTPQEGNRGGTKSLWQPGVVWATMLLVALTAASIGFLYITFTQSAETARASYQALVQRDSLLQQCYQSAIEVVELYQKDRTEPIGRSKIDSIRNDRLVDLRRHRERYLASIENLSSHAYLKMDGEARVFFRNIDTLLTGLHQFNLDRGAPLERTNWLAVRFIKMAEAMDVLQRTDQEFERGSTQESIDRLTALATYWLVGSLIVFGLVWWMVVVSSHRIKPLSDEEHPVRTLLQYSNSPVAILNKQLQIDYVNPAFERWTSIHSSQVKGTHLSEWLRPEGFVEPLREPSGRGLSRTLSRDAQPEGLLPSSERQNEQTFANEIGASLRSGSAWSSEVEIKDTDRYCSLVVSPVLDTKQELFEAICIFTDLTEQRGYAKRSEEARKQYQNIVESALDGIVVVQDGRIIYLNPAAVAIFGYTAAEELQSTNFTDIIAPGSRPFAALRVEGRSIGDEILKNYELRGVSKQGRVIDLEINARVIEWNTLKAVHVSIRDITERKTLEREQALWLWEQETLSDIDQKLIGIVDLKKILEAILQQTLNLTRAHWAGVLLMEEGTMQAHWKAARGNTHPVTSEIVMFKGQLAKIFDLKEPLILHHQFEGSRETSMSFAALRDEGIVSSAWFPLVTEGVPRGVLVAGFRHNHDFAGRELRLLVSLAEKSSIALANAQLYEDLLQREKELEMLSGARVRAQEEERRRISREIHDGLGQMLTAIKFNLEVVEDTITAGDEDRRRIEDMKTLLDNVMKEAREISYNLMPGVLVDFGLSPALQLLVEQYGKRHDVKAVFQAHGISERFDPALEVGLYRITQEALQNIGKHARATEITVQLVRHAAGVNLSIEDNGVGMDQKPNLTRAMELGGMGLAGMRERATTFGGTLTIDSALNAGTTITVEIPLNETSPYGKNQNTLG